MFRFQSLKCVVVKNEKKHIKRKKEREHMKIILLGGCNWLGRDLMTKLLSEKINFHLTWVDNLSSEYSSRHFTWDFEYLKGDCYDFKYGDITNYSFLKSIMSESAILIYNVWSDPDAILGMDNITKLSKEFKCKFIYTTNSTLTGSFQTIVAKNKTTAIGIEYSGELVGNYDIWNKRDALDTIDYYKKIGNPIRTTAFEYYTMNSAVQFIYFFIIQDMDESILIKHPTILYP